MFKDWQIDAGEAEQLIEAATAWTWRARTAITHRSINKRDTASCGIRTIVLWILPQSLRHAEGIRREYEEAE